MPTHRHHRHHRTRRSHKRRRSSDPAPEYVISSLSRNAKDNQALVAHFRAVCARELAKPWPDQSPYTASRLRQLLILLTSAEANGDLFINPIDGQPRNPDAIYQLAAELVKPYRIEGSPSWASMKRALKLIYHFCYHITKGKEVVVGALDLYLSYLIIHYGIYKPVRGAISLVRMFGDRKRMNASIKAFKARLTSWKTLKFQKSFTRFGVSITTLIAAMVVFGSSQSIRMASLLTNGHLTDRKLYTSILTLPMSGIEHVRTGFYTLMNGASLDNVCLDDGVRPEKKIHMRKVAHTLGQLDHAVETITTDEVLNRLGLLQIDKGNTPYMWTDENKEAKLMNLLERGLHHKRRYSVSKFRRKLMALAPRTQGLHFCTSYGDIRTTTHSIATAYILFAHQLWALRKSEGKKLLPEVVHPISLVAAKRAVLVKGVGKKMY